MSMNHDLMHIRRQFGSSIFGSSSRRLVNLGTVDIVQEIFLPPARQRHASHRALWGEVRGDLDLCDVVSTRLVLHDRAWHALLHWCPIGLESHVCKFPLGSCLMTKSQIR